MMYLRRMLRETDDKRPPLTVTAARSPIIHYTPTTYAPECTGNRLTGLAVPYGQTHRSCYAFGDDAGQFMDNPIRIMPGAFTESIQCRRILLCVEHDCDKVVCDSDEGLFLEDRKDGLFFTAWPWRCPDGELAELGVLAGKLRNVSFAGRVMQETYSNNVRIVTKIHLREISLCQRGCNQNTYVSFTSAEALDEHRRKNNTAYTRF